MDTILNLDEYNKNTDLTLGGKLYNIPPITYKLRNELIALFEDISKSKDKEVQKNADLTLVAMYLNTNINGKVFTIDELEKVINAYQSTALTQFIINQIRGIEKN